MNVNFRRRLLWLEICQTSLDRVLMIRNLPDFVVHAKTVLLECFSRKLERRMCPAMIEICYRSSCYWILTSEDDCYDFELVTWGFTSCSFLGWQGAAKDLERAGEAYLRAKEKHSSQAMFNLGYMHERGLGLPLDLHLAKRYYDEALLEEPSALIPVTLALASLWLRQHYSGSFLVHFSSLTHFLLLLQSALLTKSRFLRVFYDFAGEGYWFIARCTDEYRGVVPQYDGGWTWCAPSYSASEPLCCYLFAAKTPIGGCSSCCSSSSSACYACTMIQYFLLDTLRTGLSFDVLLDLGALALCSCVHCCSVMYRFIFIFFLGRFIRVGYNWNRFCYGGWQSRTCHLYAELFIVMYGFS